ncbi:hypothetical protein [Orenia marismortui]|uniref:hypothetical protein n=1 Tax=Orenia marismortui TaxID=46469 RepID=UPI00036541A4|nr:hypothetical protein [Orenia marismortui]
MKENIQYSKFDYEKRALSNSSLFISAKLRNKLGWGLDQKLKIYFAEGGLVVKKAI